MDSYRLLLLGRPALLRGDGTEVDLPFGKPLALLSYLAVREAPVSRDALAHLLWPDSPPKRARHSLRQALFRVRSEVGEIFDGDDPVGLEPGRIETDLTEFEDALAAGDLEAASVLWRGRFLEGLDVPGSTEWERWVEDRSSRLAARFSSALSEAGHRDLAEGNPGSAVRWFRRATRVAPYSPGHHRNLVETLLLLRRTEAAWKAISRAESALRDLNTRDTLDDLRAQARAGEAGPAPDRSRSEALELPLVGRERELSTLMAQWRRVRSGEARSSVICGRSGVGKTRLAREMAERASDDDAEVVWAKCSPGEAGMRWGVVATLIHELLGRPGAAGISRSSDRVLRALVPSAGPDTPEPPPENGEPSTPAVADALWDLVGAVAYEGPVLIVIDDLHWGDAASIAALSRVAGRLNGTPCHLVLTVGTDRADDEVWNALRHLGSDQTGRLVEIGPLDDASVRELVRETVSADEDVAESVATELRRLTSGNPLFVVEVMNALREEGHLRRGDDGWELRALGDDGSLPVPDSARTIMEERIRRLPDDAQSVAGHLARRDGRTPVRNLQAATGLSQQRLVRCLALLGERRIVEWVDDVRVDFAHDQLRDAARRIPVEPGPNPVALAFRRHPVAAAIICLLLLGGPILAARGGISGASPSPPPYGGGALVAWVGDSLVQLSPDSEGGEWRVHEPDVWWPRTDERNVLPVRTTDGRLRWFGYTSSNHEEPPNPVEFLRDGSIRTILDIDGDAGVTSISPDGRIAGIRSQNLSVDRYTMDAVLVDMETGASRTLYHNGRHTSGAAWSPDGRRIFVQANGPPDTLIAFNPSGQEVSRWVTTERSTFRFCGDPDRFVARVDHPRRFELQLWNVDDSIESITLDPRVAIGNHVCSPDGSAVVYTDIVDRRPVLVLREIGSGEVQRLPLDPADVARVHWVSDSVPPVPEAIEIVDAALQVPWGQTDTLQAALRFTDGERRPVDVRWESRMPRVASVDSQGRVYGNGPGATWIDATYDDWHRDSVRVRVPGAPAREMLLGDDFRTLSTDRWIRVGLPSAAPTRIDGEPALQLLGDGRWFDGLITRDPMALPRGGTVEMEFRIDLTRRDRQRVTLCLRDAEPPSSGRIDAARTWNTRQDACLRYPSGELAQFDPTGVFLSPGFKPSVPDHLPSDGWVHVAIQLRADGEVSYFVEREHVLTNEILLDNGPDTRWRVALFGRSVDTEAYVRNLVVWEGTRFPVPSSPERIASSPDTEGTGTER